MKNTILPMSILIFFFSFLQSSYGENAGDSIDLNEMSNISTGAHIDNIPPSPITEFSILDRIGANNGLLLRWVPPEDHGIVATYEFSGYVYNLYGVEAYEIYRRLEYAYTFTLIGTAQPGSSSFLDQVPDGNTKYQYFVKAVDGNPDNSANTIIITASSIGSGTVFTEGQTVTETVSVSTNIGAPADLTITDVTDDNGGFVIARFTVSPEHLTAVNSYQFYRQVALSESEPNNMTWVLWSSVEAGACDEMMVQSVILPTQWDGPSSWTVRACTGPVISGDTAAAKSADNDILSGMSNIAIGGSIDNIAPSPIIEFSIEDKLGSNEGLLLEWIPPEDHGVVSSFVFRGATQFIYGVEKYEIYRREENEDRFILIGSAGPGASSYLDSVTNSNMKYQYFIRSTDNNPEHIVDTDYIAALSVGSGSVFTESDINITLVTGRVIDTITSNPIEGASVRLIPSGESTLTTSNGTYTIAGIHRGEYGLVVSHDMYDTLHTSVHIESAAEIIKNISLTPIYIANSGYQLDVENTGTNTTVIIQLDHIPRINGEPISLGDYIGIFTPRGLCAGTLSWSGVNSAITVWGDDSSEEGIKGFLPGEEMIYRIWDHSENKEYYVYAIYSQGSNIFIANEFNVIENLNNQSMTFEVSLAAGWNLVSLPLCVNDRSMESVLSSIESQEVKVKSGSGGVYLPSYQINTIGEWNLLEGYQIYVNQPCTLSVYGYNIDATSVEYTLQQGWNLISYLGDDNATLASVFASISSNVILLKNNRGKVYWPEYGIDDISRMNKGQAYWIRVSSPVTFRYQTGSAKPLAIATDDGQQTVHFTPVESTGSNATVLITADSFTADGITLNEGDEIGIFTPSGICVGATLYRPSMNMAVPVWGDDSMTDEIEGLAQGEAPIYRFWDSETQSELNASAVYGTSQSTYAANAILIVNSFSIETGLMPPSDVTVSDVPNDHGHQLLVSWVLSPSEGNGSVDFYRIYRSRSNSLSTIMPLTEITSIDTLIVREEYYTILVDSVSAGVSEYLDTAVPLNSVKYYYWVQAVSKSSESAKIASSYPVAVNDRDNPIQFILKPPYPNPFNPTTTIEYSLPQSCWAKVVVYNISGQAVALLQDGIQQAGSYSITWNAADMPSGLYFCVLNANGTTRHEKLTLVK